MKRSIRSWPLESDVLEPLSSMIGMDLVVPGPASCSTRSRTLDLRHVLARGVLAMIYNPEVRINPPLVIDEDQAMGALATMKMCSVKPQTDLSHKGRAVEEWADLHFFRPIGIRIARALQPTGISADQVTLWSLVIGLVAGHLFAYQTAGPM